MMDEIVYRAWVVLLLVASAWIGLVHRLRAAKAGGPVSRRDEGLGLLVGLRLCGLLALIFVAAFVMNPRWMQWSQLALPDAVRLSGGVLGAVAVALLYAAFRALGTNVTDTVAARPNAFLVTTGPYHWVRHPLYVGFALFASSICLLTANAALMLLLAFSAVMLRLRTPKEEAKLLEKFGDAYRDYMNRTGRFLPRVRPRRRVRFT